MGAKGGKKKTTVTNIVYKCGQEAKNAVLKKTVKSGDCSVDLTLSFFNCSSTKTVLLDVVDENGNCEN